MLSDDETERQRDLPRDDAPQPPSDADDAFAEASWDDGFAAASIDPYSDNAFSTELENVSEADWDIDAALIWGGDELPAIEGESTSGLDFTL